MSESSSNQNLGLSGSTWGVHLNRSDMKMSNHTKKSKIKVQERKSLFNPASPQNISTPKLLTFANKLPSHESYLAKHQNTSNDSTPTPGPRSSLKKRKSSISLGRTKSFDWGNTLSMGDESLSQEPLSISSNLLNSRDTISQEDSCKEIEANYKCDPLARFESEISMDGDTFVDLPLTNSTQAPSNSSLRTNSSYNTHIARPVSFLGAIQHTSDKHTKHVPYTILHRDTGDSDSGVSKHKYKLLNNKEIDEYTNDNYKANICTPEGKKDDGKRKIGSSEEPLDLLTESSNIEPPTKRVRISDETNMCELHTETKYPAFQEAADDITSVTENEIYKSQTIIDKEKWEHVKKRLESDHSEIKDGQNVLDIYTLGFEEEEDVSSAKVAAAAGRTALLPLHDTSNISENGVLNMQKERLLEKVQSGRANENYQKINLKKKVFVRGRAGRMTGAKYRRQEWKKKFDEKEKSQAKNNQAASKTEIKDDLRVDISNKENDNSARNPNVSESCGESSKHEAKSETSSAKGKPKRNHIVRPKDKKSNQKCKSSDEGCSENKTKPTKSSIISNRKLSKNIPRNQRTEKSLTEMTCKSDTESPSDKGIWGDEMDDLELLSCFDKTGEVTRAEISLGNSQTTLSLEGIGTKLEPFYSSDINYNKDEVLDVLRNKFGHNDFRAGQEEAIRRILCGKSTLVQLATGSGKSLVYQLPAYMYAERYRCITLVVSPLVSLMEDQIDGLPGFLRAACFHSAQTSRQREKVVELIKDSSSDNKSKIHFLLVSPETLAGGGSLFASILRNLPPIAFVCIDEAHCVSAWSHNFRPTYLRLCRVINERLGVETLLGLTASAPESTIKDVASRLNVSSKDGIIRGKLLPNNLKLSVSRGESRRRGKEGDLVALLRSDPFVDYSSIIVYCTRRDTCEKLATIIRTQFQDRDVKINKTNKSGKRSRATSLVAEPYHAGMSAYKRKTVQMQFMSGKLRIVIATVAFGMGIDKADIRAVIHYNMPASYESYVQEIGRAGRDGLTARCHLFLDSEGQDLSELKKHIYSNSIDRHIIRKLLQAIFPEAGQDKCNATTSDEMRADIGEMAEKSQTKPEATSQRVVCAVPIQPLIEKLDMPEENISTFMCYLEEHEQAWVKLLNPTYAMCKIHCYGGQHQLETLSKRNPIVKAAMRHHKPVIDRKTNLGATIEFPVIQIASLNRWDAGVVKRELKNLQWTTYEGPQSQVKRSGVLVEFSELALHFQIKTMPSAAGLDQIQEYLYNRSLAREKAELENLRNLFNAFRKVSFLAGNIPEETTDTHDPKGTVKDNVVDSDAVTVKSEKLKMFIKDYFDSNVSRIESALSDINNPNDENRTSNDPSIRIDDALEAQLRADVRQFVNTHTDHTWTGRAVARIFHGIQSPNFPAKQWGRVRRYWRAHLDIEFPIVSKIATQEVIRIRSGRK